MNKEDRSHFAELLRALDESDTCAARIGPGAGRLRPAPRSPLRGDDDRAHPYELSHAAWHSLSHAVDHLSCLRALLRDAKVVHMYAPFSLVRAALENACAAVWMLQPPRRADRLARRLRFAVTDIRNGEQVKQVTGQPGPRSERERMEEVRAIAGRAGVDEAAVRRGAPYPEIIQAVGDSAGPAASAIYLSWKRGAGNNRAVSTAVVSRFPERGWQAGRVTISERIGAARRERRVLARVSRAAWRLEQAERERR